MDIRILLSVVLSIPFLYHLLKLVKALGLFTFDDKEKEEVYREWVKEKGTAMVVISTFVLILIVIMWIWGLLNLG